MSLSFHVTDARCYLGVRQGEFPSVEIHIAGIATKLGRLPDKPQAIEQPKTIIVRALVQGEFAF